MENFKTIQEIFVTKLAENNIIKKPQISLPLLIIAAGIGFLFLPLPAALSSKLHWFIQPFIAIVIICIGIVRWVKAPKHQYTVTKKPVKQRQVYYDVHDKNYVLACLLNEKSKDEYELRKGESTALALIAYVSGDGNFVAAQLQQYVPYQYQIVTDTLFFHEEQAQQLCKRLGL